MQIVLPPPGSFVWIRQRRWLVQAVARDRSTVRLDVARGDDQHTFLAPLDRVVSESRRRRPRAVRRQQARARLAQLFARSYAARTVASAVRAQLDVLPYQLEPALAVAAGARRVLIADEVGLGKTIQAGLVIAELVRRRRAARVLVIVPSGLASQWALELQTRFGIESREAGRAGLDAFVREAGRGADPWRRAGVVIASLDYLKQAHVLGAIPPLPWHLVIVDEAHGACGDSERHQAARHLTRLAACVLLLTATPHSGDDTRFRRLLDLGSLDDLSDPLLVFQRTRVETGAGRARHVRCLRLRLTEAETDLLTALRQFESATLDASKLDRRDAALLLLSVFRKRALSTAGAALVTFRRRLAWLESAARPAAADAVQLPLDLADDDEDADESRAIAVATGMPGRRERAWLGRLVTLAERAARSERKVRRLVALLARSDEAVIVFTEFRASLAVVARRIASVRSVAVLHGGLTAAERREALDAFRDGRATVLVATDVAGQGLNLQAAARWVISLELPWNPVRLEQRCGRVDRIGQSRTAHLTLLVARHPFEEALLLHLARRTIVAECAGATGPAAELVATVPPGERWRAALLAGETLASETTRPLASCRRWQRVARRHARLLVDQRRLGRSWPLHLTPDRPIWSRGRGIGEASTRSALLIFEVALVDAAGQILERRPRAVSVPHLTDPAGLTQGLVAEAARLVQEREASRVSRVVRMQSENAELLRHRLSRLLDRLVLEARAAATAPGLFDRRAEAEIAGVERRLALARGEIDRLVRSTNPGHLVAVPALCLVLLPS